MMATTIMISTRVNPAVRDDFIFITCILSVPRREQAAGGLI
jgi:hypothetical protein